MVEISTNALYVAIGVAVYSIIALLLAVFKNDRRFLESGRRGIYANLILLTLSSAGLFYAFISGDYSIKYVYQYSDRALPLFYKVSSFWAGQAGSLLLWTWLLFIFAGIVTFQTRKEKYHRFVPYLLIVFLVCGLFFIYIVTFMSNPFERFLGIPPDGSGLNPILQNPGMVFHPVTLYLGFVGFTVPFAFAISALITGELDSWWIRKTRTWTIFSWFFLTLGIVFGGLWAYEVLGWGGYWGWDPVENSSFMPWLTATAFLHSVMIQERRNMFKLWNMFLILLTFGLSILGTFLTRSGLVASVHSFAQSDIGPYFLSFLFVVLFVGVFLILSKYKELKSDIGLESILSRESSFLYNNLVLLGVAFTVLWGTLFPVISEAVTDRKITVGPPFFDQVTAPFFLFLLFIIGICPLIGWRKASRENLKRNFIIPFSIAIAGAVAIIIFGLSRPLPLLSFSLSLFVTTTIIMEFYRGVKVRQKNRGESVIQAFGRLIWKNRRRYGGYIIHLGVVLVFIGLTGNAFKLQKEVTLMKGERTSIGPFEVAFDGFSFYRDESKQTVEARLSVIRDGKPYGVLKPSKRFFYKFEEPNSKIDYILNKGWLGEDIYAILGNWSEDFKKVNLKLVMNPLIFWLWSGFYVMGVGALIVLIPYKKRRL